MSPSVNTRSEQQVVVGLLLAGALDRAQGVQPTRLVSIAADLGQRCFAVGRCSAAGQARAVQARPTQSASRRWTTIGDPLASEPDNLKNVTHITCQLLAWPWPASLPSCIPAQRRRIQPGQRPAMSCLKRKSPTPSGGPGGAAAPMPDAHAARMGIRGHYPPGIVSPASKCADGLTNGGGPGCGPRGLPEIFQLARLAGHPRSAQHQGGAAEQG